jgi:hypothetical protein
MRSTSARPRSFLQHGVDAHNELVSIDAVPRGRGCLACPYCATGLIAKKGRVLVPHFAHDGATCRESSESSAARIPLYDDFATLEPLARADLRLCAQLLRQTINHTSLRGWRRASLGRLLEAGLLEEVPRGERWVNGVGSHRHTEWGEQIAAATRYKLGLRELALVQERAALEKLEKLEREALDGEAARATDLRLYRAQLARLLSLDLYFLRVTADRARLHKIGVTARPIDERIPEIKTDLAEHFSSIEIEVEGVWPGRGSLELYFKRVFAGRQVRLGRLTEYFSFDGYARPFKLLSKLDGAPAPRLPARL